MSRFRNVNYDFSAHACAYIVRTDNRSVVPPCDRDVADEGCHHERGRRRRGGWGECGARSLGEQGRIRNRS